MSRKLYESDAERQKAYRERKKLAAQTPQPQSLTQESGDTSTALDATSPEPPSPPSVNRGTRLSASEELGSCEPGKGEEPTVSDEPPSATREEPATLQERLTDLARRRHASHRDGHFDPEPPGPGRWEFSPAYGWVEVEREVSYDVRTGIVVTEGGETREPVQDGWHGPAD